jgi:hypothetical protein
MDPSHVRKEAMQLHDEVRSAMREALILSTRVQRGELTLSERLHDQALILGATLRKHAAVEEHELGPVLQTLDSWGAVRRSQLSEAHDAQARAWGATEAALKARGDSASAQPVEMARAVHALVREVLRGLRWEEVHLLDPRTLHDDIVKSDTIDA